MPDPIDFRSRIVTLHVQKKYLADLFAKAKDDEKIRCLQVYADYGDDDVLFIQIADQTQ